jgi:hypothetical protein
VKGVALSRCVAKLADLLVSFAVAVFLVYALLDSLQQVHMTEPGSLACSPPSKPCIICIAKDATVSDALAQLMTWL